MKEWKRPGLGLVGYEGTFYSDRNFITKFLNIGTFIEKTKIERVTYVVIGQEKNYEFFRMNNFWEVYNLEHRKLQGQKIHGLPVFCIFPIT